MAIVDERYYQDVGGLDSLGFVDEARFVVRAFERYITVPLPWEVQSRSAMLYMPEQLIWYCVIALLPFGIVFSLRRDVLLTSLLMGVGVVAVAIIALLSGNVGTLVRLRVLATPYFASVSMVGFCELLTRPLRHAGVRAFEKVEPSWP